MKKTELTKILKEKGVKITQPRLLILDYLMSNFIHPTAEIIYNDLSKKEEISFATVYNNLNFFVKEGLLKRIHLLDDSDIFEINLEMHAHFTCRVCKKIYDVEFASKLEEKINGHNVEEVVINYKGVCKTCSGGEH